VACAYAAAHGSAPRCALPDGADALRVAAELGNTHAVAQLLVRRGGRVADDEASSALAAALAGGADDAVSDLLLLASCGRAQPRAPAATVGWLAVRSLRRLCPDCHVSHLLCAARSVMPFVHLSGGWDCGARDVLAQLWRCEESEGGAAAAAAAAAARAVSAAYAVMRGGPGALATPAGGGFFALSSQPWPLAAPGARRMRDAPGCEALGQPVAVARALADLESAAREAGAAAATGAAATAAEQAASLFALAAFAHAQRGGGDAQIRSLALWREGVHALAAPLRRGPRRARSAAAATASEAEHALRLLAREAAAAGVAAAGASLDLRYLADTEATLEAAGLPHFLYDGVLPLARKLRAAGREREALGALAALLVANEPHHAHLVRDARSLLRGGAVTFAPEQRAFAVAAARAQYGQTPTVLAQFFVFLARAAAPLDAELAATLLRSTLLLIDGGAAGGDAALLNAACDVALRLTERANATAAERGELEALAVRALEAAERLQPLHAQTLTRLAELLARAGRCAAALDVLQRALRASDDAPRLLRLRAQCLYDLGLYDEFNELAHRVVAAEGAQSALAASLLSDLYRWQWLTLAKSTAVGCVVGVLTLRVWYDSLWVAFM
jgi:hypothetical protein